MGVAQFVQLNRTFRPLPRPSGRDDESLVLGGVGKTLGWTDLLGHRRVVLLSEAGSGKTREMREVARGLKREGKPAFFLRLEHVSVDFVSAFEEGSQAEFEAWLASESQGWMFLDSIDEARLRSPQDFHAAIRIVSARVGVSRERLHVVLSGRATAWHPVTDLEFCSAQFPLLVPTEGERSSTEIGGDGMRRSAVQPAPFVVVALDDLSREQVATFALKRGVESTEQFLDDVERADAWAFAARPQDLDQLVTLWQADGRIGSMGDLVERSIRSRLAEPSQERAEAWRVSETRARDGARLLAAACSLTRNTVIAVPDGTSAQESGIDATRLLSDWDTRQCVALLSRPIFDEAIYGGVRFHHRSVREYLTAEWCAGLLQSHSARSAVEGLFFRQQYGLEVVVPSMRPILSWLVLWDDDIRARAMRLAPEVCLEGGDPGRLPLDVRRKILRDICQRIADRRSPRSVEDSAAARRFATSELASDVKELLRTYAEHEDVLWFLVRLVWQGRIRECVREVFEIAVASGSERFLRVAAIRAISAVGTPVEFDRLKSSLRTEAPVLDREVLAEALAHAEPSLETIDWVFACVDRVAARRPYSMDSLASELARLAERLPASLLENYVRSTEARIQRRPTIEKRHCEVSEAYAWLLEPAATALSRLVESRDPSALAGASVSVIHAIPLARFYSRMHADDSYERLKRACAGWQELRFALLWHAVAQERTWAIREGRELPRHWWVVSVFDSFARPFDDADFATVVRDVSDRPTDHEREIALTLAFDLYRGANRPGGWRRALKSAVASEESLRRRLAQLLRPPANPQAARQSRTMARFERSRRRREAAEARNEQKWRESLKANVDRLRDPQLGSVSAVSQAQWFLLQRLAEIDSPGTKYSLDNWAALAPAFGSEVARAFRDGAVSYWRRSSPMLRSEGADVGRETGQTVFGLAGLAIEANETGGWAETLSESGVESAFRYAMHELNGFPPWFRSLSERHPAQVHQLARVEVAYELGLENEEPEYGYLLSDVQWSGDWFIDDMGVVLCDLVRSTPPRSLRVLESVLSILNRSLRVEDATLASIAALMCEGLAPASHVPRWFGTWIGVHPDNAVREFERYLATLASSRDRVVACMECVTQLMGTRWAARSAVRPAFRNPAVLARLFLLMHKHIRMSEDIDRSGGGVFSPGLRDDAQDARNALAELIKQVHGKESFVALSTIALEHPNVDSRPWFARQAREKAEADSDDRTLSTSAVVEFAAHAESTPADHRALFELAVRRIESLRQRLEQGDSSIASLLRPISEERQVRKYIGEWCRDQAQGRYSVPQEEELADGRRPDLRFHGASFDGPVPCELKLADNWTGPALLERLENQLCGDYLRDSRSRCGVFILVYRGQKLRWRLPGGSAPTDFSGLLEALRKWWRDVGTKLNHVDEVEIIGVDLTLRGGTPALGRRGPPVRNRRHRGHR